MDTGQLNWAPVSVGPIKTHPVPEISMWGILGVHDACKSSLNKIQDN